eukprot:2703745-Pyramimonas_sp.AAC.1
MRSATSAISRLRRCTVASSSATCRGDQSREGRENIPVGETSHARGERTYLPGAVRLQHLLQLVVDDKLL